MTGGHSREYLNAFVDGELTTEERLQLLRQMERDPALKAAACELRTLKEMVRAGYAEVPAPRRSGRSLMAWPPLRQALAAALLMGCGLVAGWYAHDLHTQPPTFDRLAGLPEAYRPVAATRRVDPDRLVLHVDTSDRAVFDRALRLAESLLAHDPQRRRVEIVVHSGGLDLLRSDVTPYREQIQQLARRHANVSFVACGNTVARLKREGKTVVLLPEARLVSSAVGEIIERMQQGWLYIKV